MDYDQNFMNFLSSCLPPLSDGRQVRVTSGYGPRRISPEDRKAGGSHRAIDCSYPHNGTSIPRGVYPIYCPFSGTVVSAGKNKYNGIYIDDGNGYLHGFLHGENLLVESGQAVSAGQPVAHLGMAGASAVHFHYQIKKLSTGEMLDPEAFWAGTKQVFVSDGIKSYDLAAATDAFHNQLSEQDGASTVAGYMPRRAATSPAAFAQPAVWTNRVPQHEPWPRTLMGNTKDQNAPSDEYEYNTKHEPQLTDESEDGSKLIGRLEGDETIIRGPFWRR